MTVNKLKYAILMIQIVGDQSKAIFIFANNQKINIDANDGAVSTEESFFLREIHMVDLIKDHNNQVEWLILYYHNCYI